MLSSNPAIACIVCLNTAHDHDANGVCEHCQYVHHNTYEEVLALVSANDVHIVQEAS